MTINIVLFNSALELTRELGSHKLKHPVFINDMRRRKLKSPGDLLLDIAIHSSGMSPVDRENRGRPDIVHQILLQYRFNLALGNITSAFKEEKEQKKEQLLQVYPLRLWIHLPQDEIFEVLPEWRIPVSYTRFCGIMEVLLQNKKLETPPILIRKISLSELMKELSPEKIILWTKNGIHTNWVQISKESLEYYQNNSIKEVWLIGGYQRGPPPEAIINLSTEQRQLASYGMPAWKVFGTLLTLLELQLREEIKS